MRITHVRTMYAKLQMVLHKTTNRATQNSTSRTTQNYTQVVP